jgi:DNA repair protein RecO
MQEEKTKAITLQSIPYNDKSKIINVLTKDYGVISLFVNDINSKKNSFMSISSLFCSSEILYQKKSSEIFTLKDATVIDDHFFLRKELSFIASAMQMAKAVLTSQFPQKKALGIYLLLEKYLKNIPINPVAISSSFILKLLSYEDFLALKENCNVCSNKSLFLNNGESLCSSHAPDYSFNFTEEEYTILLILTYARNFSLLKDLEISSDLSKKIKNVFQDLSGNNIV